MEEIIARRYVKALCSTLDLKDVLEVIRVLKPLIAAFCNQKFLEILSAPFLKENQKVTFILELLQTDSNYKQLSTTVVSKLKNFLGVLSEHHRLNLLPSIYSEMVAVNATQNKEYLAHLFGQESYDSDFVSKVESVFSKKLGVKLKVEQERTQQPEVRIVIEDLGVESSFSSQKFQNDLKSHILKAF